MTLTNDANYKPIQGFAPSKGLTISGTYTPSATIGVRLGADVDITIDGKTLSYLNGEGLILLEGISYTFSTSVNVHIMD